LEELFVHGSCSYFALKCAVHYSSFTYKFFSLWLFIKYQFSFSCCNMFKCWHFRGTNCFHLQGN